MENVLDKILEKLQSLEEGQHETRKAFQSLEVGQHETREAVQSLQVGQNEFRKEMAEAISTLNKKLDHISEQVSQNTVYQIHMNNLSKKVEGLEIDIKVIKKAITNQ
ncbi:hypothetical protein [Ammoniphilus sp. YIM 78166]|uniref:hypothetical protein n=1 Tax=Ammoniphilus sp. YIM 78166 TaxID=1644106 RepID=UPI00106FEC9E|nr:hypothetical protein [Ammoniphilus sp. YIM 78166]